MREDDTDLLATIRQHARLPRTHASFYNWTNKGVKETGLVDEFLDPHNHGGQHQFTEFEVPPKDPPDAILIDDKGDKTPLEIAELVNEAAIGAQIEHDRSGSLQSARAYSYECEKWARPAFFEERVNSLIDTKNRKCGELLEIGARVQLLLHTDEMYFESYCRAHLEAGVAIDARRFERVWLLLSYSPGSQSCPLIEISGDA